MRGRKESLSSVSSDVIREVNESIEGLIDLSEMLVSLVVRKSKAPLAVLTVSGLPMTVRTVTRVLNELGYDVVRKYVRSCLERNVKHGLCVKIPLAMNYYYVPKEIRNVAALYCGDTIKFPAASNAIEEEALRRLLKGGR